MGNLAITTYGSFPHRRKDFTAADHGHAHAVIEALRWLSDEVLPAAVEQDMRLLEQGARPSGGFYPSEGA